MNLTPAPWVARVRGERGDLGSGEYREAIEKFKAISDPIFLLRFLLAAKFLSVMDLKYRHSHVDLEFLLLTHP